MRSRSQIHQTTRATFRIHTIRQPVAIYVATEKETVQIIPFQCAYNGRKSNTYLIIRQCRLRDKISPVTIAYHVQPDSIPVRELLPGLLAVQISRNRYPEPTPAPSTNVLLSKASPSCWVLSMVRPNFTHKTRPVPTPTAGV